jgi:hypothetical protein
MTLVTFIEGLSWLCHPHPLGLPHLSHSVSENVTLEPPVQMAFFQIRGLLISLHARGIHVH